MNNTAMELLAGTHSYMPFNDGSVLLSPLKGVISLVQFIVGILLIVAYFYLWNKSGIRIMGQTYHEACYDKPYVCVSYKRGYCDWCKSHDQREVHKLKQMLYLFMGFPEDAGLINKGYEDIGIQRDMIKQTALVFILSAAYGFYQFTLTGSVIKLAINYESLTKLQVFLIKISAGVGVFFILFLLWGSGVFAVYQFFRVREYNKTKYGYDIYDSSP